MYTNITQAPHLATSLPPLPVASQPGYDFLHHLSFAPSQGLSLQELESVRAGFQAWTLGSPCSSFTPTASVWSELRVSMLPPLNNPSILEAWAPLSPSLPHPSLPNDLPCCPARRQSDHFSGGGSQCMGTATGCSWGQGSHHLVQCCIPVPGRDLAQGWCSINTVGGMNECVNIRGRSMSRWHYYYISSLRGMKAETSQALLKNSRCCEVLCSHG